MTENDRPRLSGVARLWHGAQIDLTSLRVAVGTRDVGSILRSRPRRALVAS